MKVKTVAAVAAVLCCMAGFAQGQRAKTPEAREFGVWVDDGEHLIVGIVEIVPGTDEGVGFTVRCIRQGGVLEGTLAFGFFPRGKRVQAAVKPPRGRIERFGPVVVGGARSGFHVPVLERRQDVVRLIRAGLQDGALISNGHNSVWNRLGKKRNAEARKVLESCAGELR